MVRGLDYYTKTTFEFVHDGLGAQSGLGGGGRYDGLMACSAASALVGYGVGVERTSLACRAEGVAAVVPARRDVFGLPLGESARSRLLGCWPTCARASGASTSPTAGAGSRAR